MIGALLGAIPQCGFSVLATVLFVQRLITPGTLLAVYISTSDEAVPLLIANPARAHIMFPLIAIKVLIGIITGFIVDAFWVIPLSTHKKKTHEHGCCDHEMDTSSTEQLLWHPIVHTFKIAVYVFVITVLLNLIIAAFSVEVLLSQVPLLMQPLLTTLIGLIPNCAASVLITEMYLKGTIGFGAMLGGLCASSGLGLLILYRQEKRLVALQIMLILILVSYTAGLIFTRLIT
jgi:hypothetical protein